MADPSPEPEANAMRHVGAVEGDETGLKPVYDASWAVVIGIDNYQHANNLQFAVSDAAGMASLLIGQLGFQRERVLVLLDPPPAGELPFDLVGGEGSKAEIEELLFTRLPEVVGRDDRVLIFYAGHGESRELPDGRKKGYLVPATGEPGRWHTLIAMDDVVEAGDLIAAKHVFYLLDACFSGLATARSGVAPSRYEAGMLTNRARQALTAGTARQAVADAGPGGHSLFTGYVLNGLRGEARQPGSTAITATDLMVYVKNSVGRAFDAQQTPDFGSLPGHESGGDFVFVLPPEDDLYEQAVAALGRADLAQFRVLTKQVNENRPQDAETLYLQYRLHLLEDDIDAAIACVRDLQQANRSRAKIPLSDNDLADLTAVLPYWKPVLQVPEGSSLLAVSLLIGRSGENQEPAPASALETCDGVTSTLLSLPAGGVGEWRVVNNDSRPLHIYYIQFTSAGRLEVGPLLNTTTQWLLDGLAPGVEERTFPFPLPTSAELVETRIFAVPVMVRQMVSPPNFNARAMMTFDDAALAKLASFQRTTIWYRTVPLDQPVV